MTGRTVVTREPEWDDYARDRAMALLVYESGKCPTCGNYDTVLVSDLHGLAPVHTTLPDGRVVAAKRYRCFACAVVDIAKRDWMKATEKEETFPGQPSVNDGLMFVAQIAPEEDE